MSQGGLGEAGQLALLPSCWAVYGSLGLKSVYFNMRVSEVHHSFQWLIFTKDGTEGLLLVQAAFTHTVRAKMVRVRRDYEKESNASFKDLYCVF